MEDVLGLISLHEYEEDWQGITRHRPLAAVPFGGRYRIIDFVLSSMVNSGIASVGILLHKKCRSIMEHLRSGKEWDLCRKTDGLFILPQSRVVMPAGSGNDCEALWNNLDFIESSRKRYVLLTGSQIVCNMNYLKALKAHQETGADVTVLYKNAEGEQPGGGRSLALTGDGRVLGWAGSQESRARSMDMFIVNKQRLLEMITSCKTGGGCEFIRDGILRQAGAMKVYGWLHKGYMARIDSVQSYYQHNMELLKPEKWQELFLKAGLIHSKVHDEPPATYKDSAVVHNVMVADGCVVEGRVENSILFRGVRVRKGAYVRDSILMQDCDVAEQAVIEQAIFDKEVRVSPGQWLKGETGCPLVIAKGVVV